MNHWIFVIKDDERVFDLRIKQKKWPIYPATKFQKYLKIGDIIMFYRAGKYGQYFLGTALVNSKVKPTPDGIDLHIDIDKIDVWKERPSIRGMLSQLSFIKSQEYWGLYLQGGVVKINKKDYSIIIKEPKKIETKKIETNSF